MKKVLQDRKYVASDIDPCLYLGNGMIVLIYFDDCIIFGNNMKEIDPFIDSLKNGPEKFALTDEGDIKKILSIKITQLDKKQFKASQPFLINIIISFLGFNPDEFDTKKILRHLQLLKFY